jgi:GTP 3',8-cyclase
LNAPTSGLSTAKLVDGRGRVGKKLRISVTDRCNFACLFCMPEKDKANWLPASEMISLQDVGRVARVFVGMGIENIRITGGEPLLRPRLEDLVSDLRAIGGLRTLDMTTNGWFLEEKAEALRGAGLRGVTVSLHSLQEDRFAKISGARALRKVLAGIEAATRAGLRVKVNSVAIKGYNDDEIVDLVGFAHERKIHIRFIEFMPLDGLGIWRPDAYLAGSEILEKVKGMYGLVAEGRARGSTASFWRFADGPGGVGLITPMSDPFCDDCDRVRLTSDGKMLSCLFDTEYHDLKPLLRSGASDGELASFMADAFRRKPAGVAYMSWATGSWAKPRNMNAIGG